MGNKKSKSRGSFSLQSSENGGRLDHKSPPVLFEGPEQVPLILSFKNEIYEVELGSEKSENLGDLSSLYFDDRRKRMFVALTSKDIDKSVRIFQFAISNDSEKSRKIARLQKIFIPPRQFKNVENMVIDYWNRLIVQQKESTNLYVLKNGHEIQETINNYSEDFDVQDLEKQPKPSNWSYFPIFSHKNRSWIKRVKFSKNIQTAPQVEKNGKNTKKHVFVLINDCVVLMHLKNKKILRKYNRIYPQSTANFLNIVDFDIENPILSTHYSNNKHHLKMIVQCQGLIYSRCIFGGTLGEEIVLKNQLGKFILTIIVIFRFLKFII